MRRLREQRGLSQEELGRPMTRAAVSKIELGLATPSLHALALFARRLGVSVRELLPPD
ncbi:MAG TPA: helix-turn-helix transcriptional regulator [Chloroflexota bacterium]|nr:helix-turn-helix transcriptional regulator [Chloroflexota bacterium]